MVKKTVLQTYSFREGLRDGLPIALGYLTVAFGFGLTAVQAGLYPLTALILSLINETSAGQTAGLSVIAAHGTLIEMALTQFIINLRYSLMAISLSQRVDASFTVQRAFFSVFPSRTRYSPSLPPSMIRSARGTFPALPSCPTSRGRQAR